MSCSMQWELPVGGSGALDMHAREQQVVPSGLSPRAASRQLSTMLELARARARRTTSLKRKNTWDSDEADEPDVLPLPSDDLDNKASTADDEETRKLKRLLRNRQSAQQARDRKKQQVQQLQQQVQQQQQQLEQLKLQLADSERANATLRKIIITVNATSHSVVAVATAGGGKASALSRDYRAAQQARLMRLLPVRRNSAGKQVQPKTTGGANPAALGDGSPAALSPQQFDMAAADVMEHTLSAGPVGAAPAAGTLRQLQCQVPEAAAQAATNPPMPDVIADNADDEIMQTADDSRQQRQLLAAAEEQQQVTAGQASGNPGSPFAAMAKKGFAASKPAAAGSGGSSSGNEHDTRPSCAFGEGRSSSREAHRRQMLMILVQKEKQKKAQQQQMQPQLQMHSSVVEGRQPAAMQGTLGHHAPAHLPMVHQRQSQFPVHHHTSHHIANGMHLGHMPSQYASDVDISAQIHPGSNVSLAMCAGSVPAPPGGDIPWESGMTGITGSGTAGPPARHVMPHMGMIPPGAAHEPHLIHGSGTGAGLGPGPIPARADAMHNHAGYMQQQLPPASHVRLHEQHIHLEAPLGTARAGTFVHSAQHQQEQVLHGHGHVQRRPLQPMLQQLASQAPSAFCGLDVSSPNMQYSDASSDGRAVAAGGGDSQQQLPPLPLDLEKLPSSDAFLADLLDAW